MKTSASPTAIKQDSALTVADVAREFSVSEATVRNWIKTGYLKQVDRNLIAQDSVAQFSKEVAGKEKLTSRANKSQFDDHDHDRLVATTISDLEAGSNPSMIAEQYEASLSNTFRNKEGIYYTPADICKSMLSDIPTPQDDWVFCDPCCGSGNFILAALERGFRPENVHGLDTDPAAVEITKKRILQATGYTSENIVCQDFLGKQVSRGKLSEHYDVIVTNPPWGKKLSKVEKSKYAMNLDAGRSNDTCSFFFFASLIALKKGGYMGLLLPDSFFNISTFQNSREALLRRSVISLRDFGRPFKGLLTKAQSFMMRNSSEASSIVRCQGAKGHYERPQVHFLSNPAAIINLDCTPGDSAAIEHIFRKPHITLKGNAKWGLGIVTGNNNRFCKDLPAEGLMPVYKGRDVHRGFLTPPTTFIPKDTSLYQQVAPIDLFEAKEKILYRFICSELVFFHDTEQSYCLNSVNMIVVADSMPVSTAGIVKLFNSELYSWVFKKVFNTHKILRADLEKMPIPVDFLIANENFTEDELLSYYEIERAGHGTFRIKE